MAFSTTAFHFPRSWTQVIQFFNLHLENVLFDVIFPSVLGSSLWPSVRGWVVPTYQTKWVLGPQHHCAVTAFSVYTDCRQIIFNRKIRFAAISHFWWTVCTFRPINPVLSNLIQELIFQSLSGITSVLPLTVFSAVKRRVICLFTYFCAFLVSFIEKTPVSHFFGCNSFFLISALL